MDDNAQSSIPGPLRPWPWWSICSTHDQNVTADLEFVRIELAKIQRAKLTDADLAILDSCGYTLAQCLQSHRRIFFKNAIFVRQSILVILQNLILIMPPDGLRAAWISIKQRRLAIEAEQGRETENKPDFDKKSVDDIDKFLTADSPQETGATGSGDSVLDERVVREMVREIRARLDERLVLEYWASIVLQHKTRVLFGIALLFLVLTGSAILFENGCVADHIFSCSFGATSHQMITTILAGVLGGALSTISQPAPVGALPLVRTAFIRPLLGGIAGIFLYLVTTKTSFVSFSYPYLYAAAMAFGFSERAFVDALTKSATHVAAEATKAIGQTGDGEPRHRGRKTQI